MVLQSQKLGLPTSKRFEVTLEGRSTYHARLHQPFDLQFDVLGEFHVTPYRYPLDSETCKKASGQP